MFQLDDKSKEIISHRDIDVFRSKHPELFWRKDVLKILSKFTGEHPCRSAIFANLYILWIEKDNGQMKNGTISQN